MLVPFYVGRGRLSGGSGKVCNFETCKSRVLRQEKEIAHCAVCYDVDGLVFFVVRKLHEICGGAN
jgi:hypothetical protein